MLGIQEPPEPMLPKRWFMVLLLLIAPAVAAEEIRPQTCTELVAHQAKQVSMTSQEIACAMYECTGDFVSYAAECVDWPDAEVAGIQEGADGFPAMRCLLEPTAFGRLECLLAVVLDDGSPFLN